MRLLPMLSALLLSLLLAACGEDGAGPGGGGPEPAATLDTFPVTLEGHLTLDVSEGDEDFGAYSDWNFGELTVGEVSYLVSADGPVAQAGGLPPEGGRARVTISGMSDEYGAETYIVSRIETL
jgi:hypothetical protein